MEKRIVIFSLEQNERIQMENIIRSYFKKNFSNFYDWEKMDIQGYSRLNEPDIDDQVGHQEEILVALDKRSILGKRDIKKKGEVSYSDLVEAGFNGTLNLCVLYGIPCLVYKGELDKDNYLEDSFVNKLNVLKPEIKIRLENIFQSSL